MILSIETATDLCGAALVHGGRCVAARTVAEKNIHSEKLLVLIDELLNQTHHSVRELDGIAVSIGPGSFTGLRIGLSAAKGLAFACRLPILPVPTLDALAEEAVRVQIAGAGDCVCALIDAKRDEAYYAFFACTMVDSMPALRSLSAHAIAAVDVIANQAQAHLAGSATGMVPNRIVFVGDGARKFAPHAESIRGAAVKPRVHCSPASVGILAERRFDELCRIEAAELEPVYIRDFVTTMPRVANQTTIP